MFLRNPFILVVRKRQLIQSVVMYVLIVFQIAKLQQTTVY